MSEENPFDRERKKIEQETHGDNPPIYTKFSLAQKWGIGIVAFVLGMVLGFGVNSPTPLLTALAFGFLFVGPVLLMITKEGLVLRRGFPKAMSVDGEDQQQQQVGTGHSEETVVCRECGWQNPESNNYCHDCGSSLDR